MSKNNHDVKHKNYGSDRTALDNAKRYLPALLRSVGRDPDKGNMHCLWHPDRNPSMSYIADSDRVYCHSCKRGGDIVDVYAEIHGLDPKSKAAIDGAIEFAGTSTVTPSMLTPRAEPHKKKVDFAAIKRTITDAAVNRHNINCLSYLSSRGFTSDDWPRVFAFGVGYDPIHNDLIIPHGETYYTARFIYATSKSERFKRNAAAPVQPFNIDAINNPYFGITEGALDALSLIVCGLPTTALGGAGSFKPLLKALSELANKPFAFIAFDNDVAGHKNASHLARELATLGVRSRIIIPDNAHDYNDLLRQNRESLVEFVKQLPDMVTTESPADASVAAPIEVANAGETADTSLRAETVKDIVDSGIAPQTPPAPRQASFEPPSVSQPDQPIVLPNSGTTDADIAEQIVYGFAKGKLLYNIENGKFLLYHAPTWFELAKDADLRVLVRNYRHFLMHSKLPGFTEVVGNLTSEKKIGKIVTHCHSFNDLWIKGGDLNPDNFLLNCRNGVVDLRTGELRGHSPTYLFTTLANVDFDPSARSDIFEHFLETTIGDADTRRALQTYLGYCLTGDISEEKALFVIGTGGNGKGTLFRSVLNVLGDYGTPFKIDALLAAHRTQDANAASPEFNKLEFRRLAVAEEVPAHRKLDSAQFKLLTGGDYLPVRRLHQEARTIKHVTHKLILSGNSLPELSNADDEGLKRRLLVLEFKNAFDEHSRDPKLKQKLSTPTAQSAILNWLLEGCLQWQQHGLITSKEMQQARSDYLLSQDHLGDFISEHCLLDANAQVLRKDFIAAVRKHGDYDARNMTDKEITNYLITKENITVKRLNAGRAFIGIKLMDDETN